MITLQLVGIVGAVWFVVFFLLGIILIVLGLKKKNGNVSRQKAPNQKPNKQQRKPQQRKQQPQRKPAGKNNKRHQPSQAELEYQQQKQQEIYQMQQQLQQQQQQQQQTQVIDMTPAQPQLNTPRRCDLSGYLTTVFNSYMNGNLSALDNVDTATLKASHTRIAKYYEASGYIRCSAIVHEVGQSVVQEMQPVAGVIQFQQRSTFLIKDWLVSKSNGAIITDKEKEYQVTYVATVEQDMDGNQRIYRLELAG